MASTNFIDKQTIIQASWLNALNSLMYDIFEGAVTKQAACEAIGAIRVEGEPTDGQVPTWDADAEVWVPGDSGGGGGGVTNPLVLYGNIGGAGDPIRILFLNTFNDNGYGIECSLGAGQIRFVTVVDGTVDSTRFSFDLTNSIATATGNSDPEWAVNPE
jgi:hypothetical protein